jgi:hypothetical protein
VEETAQGIKYVGRPGYESSTAMYYEMIADQNFLKGFLYKRIDSISKVINQLREDSIKIYSQTDDQQLQRITIKDAFRAKNKFGGYVRQTAWILWYPDKGFVLNTIE